MDDSGVRIVLCLDQAKTGRRWVHWLTANQGDQAPPHFQRT
jgi:hypothetical protein